MPLKTTKTQTQSRKKPANKRPVATATTAAVKPAAPARRVRRDREVEIDEPRQRAGDAGETAFQLETSEGTDALAEELGEEFVENVTGANDSASDHRDQELLEEQGSFVVTSAETEFGEDFEGEPPAEAETEEVEEPRPS